MNFFDFDLHTHTQYSDGRNNVPEMLNAAADFAKGVKFTIDGNCAEYFKLEKEQ